jgi:hypothetical protein
VLNLIKFYNGTCVIRIPRLFHLEDPGLELSDERQDAYSIGKHGEWVSPGHAFFAEDKEGMPNAAVEHEYHPVFVAIKYKPCAVL